MRLNLLYFFFFHPPQFKVHFVVVEKIFYETTKMFIDKKASSRCLNRQTNLKGQNDIILFYFLYKTTLVYSLVFLRD